MTYYYKLEGAVVKSAAQIDGCEEISETEYKAMKAEAEQSESRKQAINDFLEQYKRRPFTAEEVTAMLIRQQINILNVDDNTALRMTTFYPEWAANAEYTIGYKVQRSGRLWRCLQAHTSQAGWEPENAASLWTEICESHSGTLEDPIPYNGNMALESGKYYSQDGKVYRCTRDTGNPVYNALSELVGLYVEEV